MSAAKVFSWAAGVGHGLCDHRFFEQGHAVSRFGRVTWRTLLDGAPQVPVRRRVTLFRLRDMKALAAGWSDSETGSIVFRGLPLDELYVAGAWDHTGEFEYLAGGPMPATLEA